jgi:hypothetical protein
VLALFVPDTLEVSMLLAYPPKLPYNSCAIMEPSIYGAASHLVYILPFAPYFFLFRNGWKSMALLMQLWMLPMLVLARVIFP